MRMKKLRSVYFFYLLEMLLSRMEKRRKKKKAILVFAMFFFTLFQKVCYVVMSCVFDTLFLLSIFNVADERREKSEMRKLFIFWGR